MRVSDPEEARRSGIKVYYYLFDLLHLDGYDTTDLLVSIKSILPLPASNKQVFPEANTRIL